MSQASLLASVIMLGVSIGKVILGIINDKNNICGLLTTIGCGILGLIMLIFGCINFYLLIIGGFLFGWAYAGVTIETSLLVRSVFGGKDYSRIYSNIAIALASGGTLMAGGWGILADYLEFTTILLMGVAFLVISRVIGVWSLWRR